MPTSAPAMPVLGLGVGAKRSRDRTVRSTGGPEGELFPSHNKDVPVSGKHSISSTNFGDAAIE